jgi:hypothetical protein
MSGLLGWIHSNAWRPTPYFLHSVKHRGQRYVSPWLSFVRFTSPVAPFLLCGRGGRCLQFVPSFHYHPSLSPVQRRSILLAGAPIRVCIPRLTPSRRMRGANLARFFSAYEIMTSAVGAVCKETINRSSPPSHPIPPSLRNSDHRNDQQRVRAATPERQDSSPQVSCSTSLSSLPLPHRAKLTRAWRPPSCEPQVVLRGKTLALY